MIIIQVKVLILNNTILIQKDKNHHFNKSLVKSSKKLILAIRIKKSLLIIQNLLITLSLIIHKKYFHLY